MTLTAPPEVRGLSARDAARRVAEVGPNVLAAPRPRPGWLRFADQFRNPLVMVLLGAAPLAAFVGDLKNAIVIAVIVMLNAMLGFLQERRAEHSLEALRSLLVTHARVRRDGMATVVDSADIVPEDVVLLEAGDRVPADGRWVVAHEVAVDESALTGESEPVGKEPDSEGFMNTVVTRGRGELLVSATGMATRTGRVAELLRSTEETATPLQRQLARLAKRLVAVAAVAVAVVFAAGLARGGALSEEVLNAVALAAAAIPEGLPAVVTVTLALGTRYLARRGAIVKRLASVETLGATTVICSDKTGTLTMNEMTVRSIVSGGVEVAVSGEGYGTAGTLTPLGGDTAPDLHPLLVAAALCNDSRLDGDDIVGDPMEAALLVAAVKAGVDLDAERHRLPRVGEVPFDSARRYMVTFHAEGDRIRVFVKGAPDVLVQLSDLDPVARAAVAADGERLAARGLRTLAAATTTIASWEYDPAEPLRHVHDLAITGVVGIMDPPRPEAKAAIATCRRAGIAVKMITGDHAATARAIASELAIGGEVVTGAELDSMGDGELARQIDGIGVFARVAPEHKVRIVDALRARDEVVAMTGDGVNDAPALKRADIGVAMGCNGTEVSKEAATMVLTDDNFATIVAAVHRGRAIYDDIVKFVRFQLTTNVGAIVVLVTAAALGLARPFSAIHVLWVNLITDGPPGVALGVDPPEPATMSRPPRRPGCAILTLRRLGVIALHGGVMAAGTLGVFWWAGADGSARATTLAFTTFVLFQVVNALNVRVENGTILSRHTLTNSRLWTALVVVVVLQVAAVQLPLLHDLFDTTGLGAGDWVVATAVALSLAVVEEVRIRLLSTERRRSPGDRGAPERLLVRPGCPSNVALPGGDGKPVGA